MRVLVAIPVFNERRYVERVLDKVSRFARDILCIDDGSTDGTAELLAGRAGIRLIRHPSNLGYGQSLIDAFDYAHAHGFDWVITMDCDEQHEPERIPDFLAEIRSDRWDVISGSRYLRPDKTDDLPPGERQAINATITAVINGMFDWSLTDAFCGFKAHRVSCMKGLSLTETGYAFPMQFWPRVHQAGLRVTEIPVRLIYNDPNRSFGGQLDDASHRLRHYLDVLARETRSMDSRSMPDAVCCACG